jgi:hypothetical protein
VRASATQLARCSERTEKERDEDLHDFDLAVDEFSHALAPVML